MEKQQIIDYVIETPENINPAILGQMIDEVGGGGSGDFSICTGTFICDGYTATSGVEPGNLIIIDTANQYYGTDGGLTSVYGRMDGDCSFSVVLYNGKQNVSFASEQDGDIVSTSGGISLKENGMYEITGDFTMHFLARQMA